MKQALIHGAIAAAALLITSTQTWAAEDILSDDLGRDWEMMYDSRNNLLLLLGNDGDNEIEVACGVDGSVRFVSDSISTVSWFKQTPIIAIHGGGGNDIVIGHRIPVLAMNGGLGDDILIWDNAGTEANGGTQDINIGVGELQECTISKSMDMAFHEATYAGDLILWNESEEGSEAVYGGAGLDILIGNTGGDRLQFGDLGNDWIVGGTERDADIIGGWGNDWISGGVGSDGASGGFGNDLLNADDVMTVQKALTYDPGFRGGVFVAAGDVN